MKVKNIYTKLYLIMECINLCLFYLIAIRVIVNGFKNQSKYDFFLLFLFSLAASPSIYEVFQFFLYWIFPNQNWDFILIIYAFSVLFWYSSIVLLSFLIFSYIEQLQLKHNYWKSWIVVNFITFTIDIIYILLNAQIITLSNSFYTLRILFVPTIETNLFILIITEIVFLPFLPKLCQLAKDNKNHLSRGRVFLIGLYFQLASFLTFYNIAFVNSWNMICLGAFLNVIANLIALYVFYPAHIGELIFMQLNVESIYITDQEGNAIYVQTFIPGKNQLERDELVGRLVKGADQMIREIKNIKKGGLNRILLADKTAIIVEKSRASKLTYIVFTKEYTQYIHKKIIKLGKDLDVYWEKNLKITNSEDIALIIKNIFYDIPQK